MIFNEVNSSIVKGGVKNMKALLIFEFEMFIKKKQYIFPIAYLIFTIAYVLYMMKVKLSHDVFYNIFL